jgi:L-iditol 2-dehydrogenase
MKKAAVFGARQGGVVDAPDPTAADNWVVVKIHTAPMCTEFKTYVSGREAPYLGHEAAGEVTEVAQPCRVKVGDRVVVMPQTPCGLCDLCLDGEYIHCQDTTTPPLQPGVDEGRATMAQFMLKQDWVLVPIPDGISYDHASMACCGLGPTFGAVQRAGLGPDETLLITGLGPVGLGGVINGTHRGARVIGVDINSYRAAKALELGATAVIDPTDADALQQAMALTRDGRGVDHSIDCSGVVAAHRFCIDATRRKGTVSFVGESGQDSTPVQVSSDLLRKGLSLHGSWHYNMADTPQILRVIAANAEKLDRLITHRFPLERVADAWDLQASGQCAKVLLKPWE